MPYVPSKKTDGESRDREFLNPFVENCAKDAAQHITSNLSLIDVYKAFFVTVASQLACRYGLSAVHLKQSAAIDFLAHAIHDAGEAHGYEGAYLGELNYAITRFIQRVPQIKVENGEWEQELRYWLYAATVEALIFASRKTEDFGIGISGVFEDIKDEYKRRVNTAYEAAQIAKSGDCYDTPYYTRLVEVVDEHGDLVGHQEIMLKRSEETRDVDILGGIMVFKKVFSSNKRT